MKSKPVILDQGKRWCPQCEFDGLRVSELVLRDHVNELCQKQINRMYGLNPYRGIT